MDYNIIILSISTLRKQVDKCVGRWGDKKSHIIVSWNLFQGCL
jgi:hypothetical protein